MTRMHGPPAVLIDVGNTRVKWGISERGEIIRSGNVTHEKLKSSGFRSITSRIPRSVSTVLVCNVAGPGFGARLAGIMGVHCNTEVHFARAERAAYGVTNGYRQPRRLGVDRWVALVGARAEFSTALCVVDAGTAITIDALDRQGMHLGGQIIPGVGLMSSALDAETSDIKVAKGRSRSPDAGLDAFARTTRDAINNGAYAAISGAIDRAVKTLRGAGFRPKIVLTGGDASRILTMLDGRGTHRPNLVLQGLAFMLRSES